MTRNTAPFAIALVAAFVVAGAARGAPRAQRVTEAETERETRDPPSQPATRRDEAVPEPVAEARAARREVAGAPRPGDVEGLEVEPRTDRRDTGEQIANALLTPLRWTVHALLFPPALMAAAVDEAMGLRSGAPPEHFDAERGGFIATPIVDVDSDVGATWGARVGYRSLLRRGDRLTLGAAFFGRYDQGYDLGIDTGELLDRLAWLEVDGTYRKLGKAHFYGIGNDDVRDMALDAPLDPIDPGAAVATRFEHKELRGTLRAPLALGGGVRLVPSVSVARYRFGETDDLGDDTLSTEMVFDTERLVGFDAGFEELYSELAVDVDRRARRYRWISRATPSSGWRLRGFSGVGAGIRGSDALYGRFGGEATALVDLYRGDRVLVMRQRLEYTAGDDDRVPFVALSELGGPHRLRGYPRGRFRDRGALLTTIEYRYPVHHRITAHLFVDAGQPFSGLDDLSLSAYRLGYGGGVTIHGDSSVHVEAEAGATIDGTVALYLRLGGAPP